MRFNDHFKHPRIYSDHDLMDGHPVDLTEEQTHYLKNVMRRKAADTVRIFNGRDGEWLAALAFEGKNKGRATPHTHFKPQPQSTQAVHLIFAPIKKTAMAFLIEKSVELGVTDLHPVITAHTENRKINESRLKKHILEAAEQCERLGMPTLHPLQKLEDAILNWPQEQTIHWCAERMSHSKTLQNVKTAHTFLIGPEGGFNDRENSFLKAQKHVLPIDLGPQILRAETAALYCLSHAKLNIENT